MNYPYAPRLDSRVQLTGTYSFATGKTSWMPPVPDDTYDVIVLGDDFGTLAGKYFLPTTIGGIVFVVPGKWDAGPVILGRSYDMSIELSQPFRRDQDGKAIIGDRLQVESVTTDHRNSGPYTITASMTNRSDRTRTLDLATAWSIEEEGVLRANLNGDSKSCSWLITSSTPLPVTVAAVTWDVDISRRSRT